MKTIPDTIAVILKRKSVRNFSGAPISKDDLETILHAAMAAPSAVNRQPWNFIAITERKTLDQLAEGLPYAKMLDKAGAAVVVCALPEKAHDHSLDYAIVDATLASQNILLAVEALGLGALWTAAYPTVERMAHVSKVLHIPAHVIPLNVIPIGVPTGEDQPKDKWNAANIHWEKW